MDDRQRGALVFVASQLVFVAALLHVGMGAAEWYRYVSVGILVSPDVRWPLFVLSGVAIVAGLALAARSAERKRWYLLGFLAMVGYVLAYFAWPLGGHRPLFVAGPSTSHPLTVAFVVDHFFAGVLETIALTVELLAAALLAVLYVFDEE